MAAPLAQAGGGRTSRLAVGHTGAVSSSPSCCCRRPGSRAASIASRCRRPVADRSRPPHSPPRCARHFPGRRSLVMTAAYFVCGMQLSLFIATHLPSYVPGDLRHGPDAERPGVGRHRAVQHRPATCSSAGRAVIGPSSSCWAGSTSPDRARPGLVFHGAADTRQHAGLRPPVAWASWRWASARWSRAR